MKELPLKQVFRLIATLVLALGCATQPTIAAAPQVDILILAPQGVDPAIDTVGFNDLAKNLTQTFSDRLVPMLQALKYTTTNVIDQSTRYDSGQKLAIYSVQHGAKMAIVLTMETEAVGSDVQIKLQAQFIRQDFSYKNGRLNGVIPTSNSTKSYFIRGSESGDNPGTMTELADDYFGYLVSSGLLK